MASFFDLTEKERHFQLLCGIFCEKEKAVDGFFARNFFPLDQNGDKYSLRTIFVFRLVFVQKKLSECTFS